MNERGQYGKSSAPRAASSSVPAKPHWWITPLLAVTTVVGGSYLLLRLTGEGSARKGVQDVKRSLQSVSLMQAINKAHERGDTAAVERLREKFHESLKER